MTGLTKLVKKFGRLSLNRLWWQDEDRESETERAARNGERARLMEMRKKGEPLLGFLNIWT